MEFFTATVISFFSILFLYPMAKKIGLLDHPCDRKCHSGTIPLVGGIAIYIATLTACSLVFHNNTTINLFLISSGLIVFLGALDDYLNLGAKIRLIAQVLIASILIFGAGRYIHYFGDLLGFGLLDIGAWGIIFTMVAILSAINAFNMTDGIDGLAGFLALNTYGSLALLFYLNGSNMLALPIILIFSIIPFLLFNLGFVPGPVKKIFMGDAGSMFIGLSVVWLLVLGTQGDNPIFRPVTALWIIAVPLIDMTVIVIRRVQKGKSPLQADRGHLHHIFIRTGFSSHQALFYIVLISLIYSAIGLTGEFYAVPEWIMFALFMLVFCVYAYGIHHAWVVVRWIRAKRGLISEV